MTKSRSNDSLISSDSVSDIAIANPNFLDLNGKVANGTDKSKQNGNCGNAVNKKLLSAHEKSKRVSFETDKVGSKVGFCTFDFYHPAARGSGIPGSDDVTAAKDTVMDKSVDSIGSCSLDVDASSTDFSGIFESACVVFVTVAY